MSDKNFELIDYPHVGIGMYLALRNAKRHLEDAKFLYDSKKFQSAILFSLSVLKNASNPMNYQ